MSLGLSLILAIGAQNAFILKQGLRREYVFVLCLICALSDAILITVGVFGFAALTKHLPAVEVAAKYAGVLFLGWYGAKSFWAALKSHAAMEVDDSTRPTRSQAILACLAFTWLNPHVYLDTLMLLGSISTQYPQEKNAFALGASLASFLFFFSLGYGARILTPIFRIPLAWRVLDFLIGCVMWGIALGLLIA